MDGDGSRRNQSLKSILPLSFNLHKRLLDVEMESIHKEIEELALKLGQSKNKNSDADQIREKLKQLFAHEAELNLQLDQLLVEQTEHIATKEEVEIEKSIHLEKRQEA